VQPAARPPPAVHSACATYDAARGRILVFGGNPVSTDAGTSETWEWDGRAWRQVPLVGARPPARYKCGLAFDSVRQRAVLFGGTSFDPLDDTWELLQLSEARPQVLAELDWSTAQVPPGALRSVEARAVAAGRGYEVDLDAADGGVSGAPVPGVGLLGWSAPEQRWVLLADDAAAPAALDAPAELSWASAGQAEAAGLVSPATGTIHVALRPAAASGNGPETAELAVDYVEVTVRYRLP